MGGIGLVMKDEDSKPAEIIESFRLPAGDFERELKAITLAPYIVKGMALIGVAGKGGGNLYRHMMYTMTVLMDYKICNPVLLKASVIHDLFEEAPRVPGVSPEEIERIDSDGPAVCALVKEVTIRSANGQKEPKSEFLVRVMRSGSDRAKILKLADRISNVTFLGFVHDTDFVKKYLWETRSWILPFAEAISKDMFRELSDLITDRENKLTKLK